MPKTNYHKTLTSQEALEYIAFAIWQKDLPENFDGKITCEFNDDGSVEVYAVVKKNKNNIDIKLN